MANKQFKPISQSTWPYTEVPTIWPEGSASGDCTRWMHIYPPRSTAELYRPHQKKQNKKKTPTHLILVLLCKCPPKNVPSNTLLSGFFFPRLLQISLPLCAQQRSENPLWQQGKKRQEKKRKKEKIWQHGALSLRKKVSPEQPHSSVFQPFLALCQLFRCNVDFFGDAWKSSRCVNSHKVNKECDGMRAITRRRQTGWRSKRLWKKR